MACAYCDKSSFRIRKWSIIIVTILAVWWCSMSAYKTRSEYQRKALEIKNEQVIEGLRIKAKDSIYQIDVLSYALTLVPENVKNEVYFNALKKKYSDIEFNTHLLTLIEPTFVAKYGKTDRGEK
jgi:hypothetical protein